MMIISAIMVFFIENILGILFAVVSLIISIKELKYKEKLNTIAFVGSIIIIVFSVVAFFVSFSTINNIITNSKQRAWKNQEKLIETYSDEYKNQMIQDGILVAGKNIIDEETLKKYNITCPDKCECYVVANIDVSNQSNNLFDAYLKCNDYTTEGFESK